MNHYTDADLERMEKLATTWNTYCPTKTEVDQAAARYGTSYAGALEHLREQRFGGLVTALPHLLADLREARAALEFYANENNWKRRGDANKPSSPVIDDAGARARTTRDSVEASTPKLGKEGGA